MAGPAKSFAIMAPRRLKREGEALAPRLQRLKVAMVNNGVPRKGDGLVERETVPAASGMAIGSAAIGLETQPRPDERATKQAASNIQPTVIDFFN